MHKVHWIKPVITTEGATMESLQTSSIANYGRKFIAMTAFLAFVISLFFPKPALAQGGSPCVSQIENKIVEGVRYQQITLIDREGCDLYTLAHDFPQMDEKTKQVLPVQVQVRSIYAASLAIAKSEGRTFAAVRRGCVPNSRPWPDQTVAEKDFCPNGKVNYYPVGSTVMIPRSPQYTEAEQMINLGEEACRAMARIENPDDTTKQVLQNCQKHFADIVIKQPRETDDQKQLKLASQIIGQQRIELHQKDALILSLMPYQAKSQKYFWLSMGAMLIISVLSVDEIRRIRKQRMLFDLAHIREAEIESRVEKELMRRGVGPNAQDFAIFQSDYLRMQDELQKTADNSTVLSQQLAELKANSKLADEANERLAQEAADAKRTADEAQEQLKEARARVAHLSSVNQQTESKINSLNLQLALLHEMETQKRFKNAQKVVEAVQLAELVLARLQERHDSIAAQTSTKRAEIMSDRIQELRGLLIWLRKESQAEIESLNKLEACDPLATDAMCFVDFLQNDVMTSSSWTSQIVQMSHTLAQIESQLKIDVEQQTDKLAEAVAKNAKLQELWQKLVKGIASALGHQLDSLDDLEPEDQANKIALAVGQMKNQIRELGSLQQKLAASSRRNNELEEKLSKLQESNASLHSAMSGDRPRELAAQFEQAAWRAEERAVQFERELADLQIKYELSGREIARLTEAVKDKFANGALALEAEDLALLPADRLVQFTRACITALAKAVDDHAKPEYIVGSDEDVWALNSFLHLPIVSSGYYYNLPPALKIIMGPVLVHHAMIGSCAKPSAQVVSAERRSLTMRPQAISAAPEVTVQRRCTMQGLGAVRGRTLNYPLSPDAIDAVDKEDITPTRSH